MSKMFAVLKREYLQAVRKKMFIIMTILLPVLMGATITLPSLLMARGLGEKKVAVLDGTGVLKDTFANENEKAGAAKPTSKRNVDMPGAMDIQYVDRHGDANIEAAAKPYLDQLNAKDNPLDGVMIIPPAALTSGDAHAKYYSRSSTDFISEERRSSLMNRGLQRYRLGTRGLSPDEIEKAMARVSVDSVQMTKTGEQKKGGGVANFLIGFIFTALLMVPSFIYGLEIMRGIIQEKTDRVVEVLVSSMSPTQLLTGKILGIALVGLTQVSVWLLLTALIGTFGAGVASMTGANLSQIIHPSIFVYFIIFFLLAYLTYVCVYAIGGAACNSDKEAQQLIAPITLLMMLPWFMIVVLITNPDSKVVVGLSMAPIFGPLTMFVRTLVSDPPITQVLVTIATSLITVALFMKVTAKIFRIGILSYGKRPTLGELWRWLKIA